MSPRVLRSWRPLLWGVVLAAVLAVQALAAGWQRVRAVVDGDTLELAGGGTVRLVGIDTPELGHGGPGQYYGRQARAELARLVDGQEVRLEVQGRDRYGRLLAVVWRRDGTMVNERLVALGAAFVFPHQDDGLLLAGRLLAAQRQAMDRGLGFWPRILALPEAREPYVGTAGSRRFHRLSCPFAARIGSHNRVLFPSLRAAFAAGFAPCRTCTPWPRP